MDSVFGQAVDSSQDRMSLWTRTTRSLLAVMASLSVVVGLVAAGPLGSAAAASAASVATPRATKVKKVQAKVQFSAKSSKLTSSSKKQIKTAVAKVKKSGVSKSKQSVVVTAKATGSCVSARSVATNRGEVACAWKVLANNRSKAIKKQLRADGYKGKVTVKLVQEKSRKAATKSRASRALSPAVSTLVFLLKTTVKPNPVPKPGPGPQPKTCANGEAECKVGDKGPGGGTVIYVSENPLSWGSYIEAASDKDVITNKQWGTGPEGGPNCQLINIPGAWRTGVGGGLLNTSAILAECPMPTNAPAAEAAVAYRGGGLDDWYLPARDELNLVCLLANDATNTQISDQVACAGLEEHMPGTFLKYWSSSQSGDSGDAFAWSQFFETGNQNDSGSDGAKYTGGDVWPVRAFGPVHTCKGGKSGFSRC